MVAPPVRRFAFAFLSVGFARLHPRLPECRRYAPQGGLTVKIVSQCQPFHHAYENGLPSGCRQRPEAVSGNGVQHGYRPVHCRPMPATRRRAPGSVRGTFRPKKVPPPGAEWQPEGGCSPQNNCETIGSGSERKENLCLLVKLRQPVLGSRLPKGLYDLEAGRGGSGSRFSPPETAGQNRDASAQRVGRSFHPSEQSAVPRLFTT
jgi:hypothetical protein